MFKWLIALLLVLPLFAEVPVMKAFEEKPFDATNKELESYRFTYLPTFDKPYLFRLDVGSEKFGALTIKRLSGKGGYELGKLELNQTVQITGKTLESFLAKLRDPKVWKPFGEHPENANMLIALDGEGWALEGVSGGKMNGAEVKNPAYLPHAYKFYANQEDLKMNLQNVFVDFNPFFQAAYLFFKISGPHYEWEKGVHSHLTELRKSSALIQSPSYRAAVEILEREEALDTDDPFGIPDAVIPTSEELLKAHAFLKKALGECPENPEPLLMLASSYYDSGNLALAEVEVKNARKLEPEDPVILHIHGSVLTELHRFPEAIKIRRQLQKSWPEIAKRLQQEISRTRSH